MNFTVLPEYNYASLIAFIILIPISIFGIISIVYSNKKIWLILLGVMVIINGSIALIADNEREIEKIAINNVEEKYDTSNIDRLYYSNNREEARGVYTNWDTGSKQKVAFIFNKQGEPKLVTSAEDTQNLKTIEKEISRN